MRRSSWLVVSALLLTGLMTACGATVPPAAVTAPHYPEFIFPALTPPDPSQNKLEQVHQGGWAFLQAGDPTRAEREFQTVLKRSPAFYPSEAGLGYVELARKNYPQALEHFDRVLKDRTSYVPALVGRGQTLLALSRDADALVSFEAAVRADATLVDVGRRVEVLRARAAQENVAAARRAAETGRLDEAIQAYQQAIAASPQSAFLYRDLADIESKQGKTDEALQHYRQSIQLDPSDVASRVHIGEILDAKGDIDGAMGIFKEAYGLESSPDVKRRITALEERAAYMKLPAEYRALSEQPAITRGDLAGLIGIRLAALLATAPDQAELVTDVRNHWAADWIMVVVRSGVMDAYENHTFQPRNAIRRSDLAQAVSRLLKLIAARQPALLKEWQGRQAKMSDVGVSNLNYADVSLAVSSGVLPLADGELFQLSRPVSGAEAIDAVAKIELLNNSAK
jgi:tetratricopeptide (TPR) repeat protein